MTTVSRLHDGACNGNTRSFLNPEEPTVIGLVTDFGIEEGMALRPPDRRAHRFPGFVSADGGALAISDTANNRVLLHDRAPVPGTAFPTEGVLAQRDLDANGENRWKAVEHDTLCWPYGLHLRGDSIAIADSGNNRMMIWTMPVARTEAQADRERVDRERVDRDQAGGI